MVCPHPFRTGWAVTTRARPGHRWRARAPLGAPWGGGAAGRRRQGRRARPEGLCGPGPRVAREGSGLPGDPAPRLCANFAFALGRLEAAGPSPERLRPGTAELIRKRLKPRGPNSTCHREADVERDRERKQAGAQSPGKVLPRLGAIIKMGPPGPASHHRPHLLRPQSASSAGPGSTQCPLSMCPPRGEYQPHRTRRSGRSGREGRQPGETRQRPPR